MTASAPTGPAQARHPYSPVRETPAGFVFISGQLGLALSNLRTRLATAGLGLEDVAKITVYLVSMSDRGAMDEVYQRSLPEPLPAHTCVAVAELPYGARVELDAIAVRSPKA